MGSMPAASALPVHANVAYLRIPRFPALGVAAQAAAKAALESRVRAVVAREPEDGFVVLDAEDGLAVVLYGTAPHALDRTEELVREAGQGVQAGLNHGPLALAGTGDGARVIGDGLGSAAAASRFAAPGKLLATRDFARALEVDDPSRAPELAPAGEFTDTRVRLHALYAPDRPGAAARARRAFLHAAGGVVAILLLGVAARLTQAWLFPPPPAVIALAVKPRGEVFVDGVSRGRTPPLKSVEIPAGKHVISLRHPGFAPVDLQLDLKAGERMTVSHTFTAARTEQKGGFWRELRRRFGGS